jgi:hypothetical protein
MSEHHRAAEDIIAIQAGCLSLSRVTYHTNLQDASGLIIPLGVIAELTTGSWRALGLIARTTLLSNEVDAIGIMIRDHIASPFRFLAPDFDWAFAETEPGEALRRLSQRYSDSVFFAPPTDLRIRKLLPLGALAAEPLLADLRRARDEEFYLMLAEANGVTEAVPSEDRTKLRPQRAA